LFAQNRRKTKGAKMYHPTLDEIKNTKWDGNLIPVYREIVADMETPVSAFLKINRGGNSFLLESVEGGQRLARYSFIGTEPYRELIIASEDKTDTLNVIQEELHQYQAVPLAGLPRFAGGAVGYLSYETVCRFENLPSPEKDIINIPQARFMLVDTMLVFDHVTHKIKVLSYVKLNGDVDKNYQTAIDKIDELVKRLKQPYTYKKTIELKNKLTAAAKLTSNTTRKDFEANVRKIKEYITAGEVIQVVYSRRLAQPTNLPPFEIYRALRTINPSPYMFYLDYGDFQIVGASPEVLVRVEDGMVMTRPLAGTRRRGESPEEDTALEQELRSDEKERAEHIMLVDLGRNDIGRVSQPGTVAVSELMDVERYSHVMHLVTHVQGKLRPDMNSFDALRACFPAGTVSGAPKVRAMEIIAEMETEKRGPYAGAVGYFSFSGNMDMAIAIRTMVVKKGVAYVQAGAGIVYDSVPSLEYDESLNKARALLKALEQAESENK
jgi:anthranilate synthase component 1